MTSLHPTELDNHQLLQQCEVQKTRRSGPGGQHRNKVETAIVLIHTPSLLRVEASERRSQPENLEVALHRLRLKLAIACRTPLDSAGIPSPLWLSRCRGGKIVVSDSHADFPRLLAEAFNHLAPLNWEVKAAADRLGCSTSQLIKLIQKDPSAWTTLQEQRRSRGLTVLY